MEITKRNGRSETYDGHKIITAMKKAFESTGSNPAPSVMADLLHAVEEGLSEQNITSVEGIQDQVERTLMEQGFLQKRKIIFSTARSVPFSGMPGPPSASPPPTGSWNRFSEKYRRIFPRRSIPSCIFPPNTPLFPNLT